MTIIVKEGSAISESRATHTHTFDTTHHGHNSSMNLKSIKLKYRCVLHDNQNVRWQAEECGEIFTCVFTFLELLSKETVEEKITGFGAIADKIK